MYRNCSGNTSGLLLLFPFSLLKKVLSPFLFPFFVSVRFGVSSLPILRVSLHYARGIAHNGGFTVGGCVVVELRMWRGSLMDIFPRVSQL